MKSILVVDDAKSMRELVKGILENEGYSVVTAADGVEGLALAREKRFDAAVVDLHMPNMNGISMVDKIRRGTESTDAAVLMLTTETSDYRKQRRAESEQTAGCRNLLIPPAWSAPSTSSSRNTRKAS